MDMKLSGTRIKELRLQRSWSQEKLADMAGLNARTVQRAESEGSGSLRTRLQLATALQVRPEALDAVPATTSSSTSDSRPAGASIHYLVVLLLVTLVYLAAQPAYFSISRTSFDWIGTVAGSGQAGQEYTAGDWLLMTLTAWSMVSLPVLYIVHKRQRALLPWLGALSLMLALAVLRGWQPGWVAEGLAMLVSLGGLALLLALYVPRLPLALLRRGLYLVLGAYVFIWFVQDISLFALSAYVGARDYGLEISERTMPLWYVGGTLLRNLGDLVQLIPAALVLALAQGERQNLLWPWRPAQAMPEPPVTP